jgi:hypothetical protein
VVVEKKGLGVTMDAYPEQPVADLGGRVGIVAKRKKRNRRRKNFGRRIDCSDTTLLGSQLDLAR